MIQIGMVGRFFPGNWRLPSQEVRFAAEAGFSHLQFMARQEPLTESSLGQRPATIGVALSGAGVGAVLEIVITLDENGRSRSGHTPLSLLEACLPAIDALAISHVHWHMTTEPDLPLPAVGRLEQQLPAQLADGVALAEAHGFRCGFEHNSPDFPLFAEPAPCAAALAAVPGLNFVWDFNHTHPDARDGFVALLPRTQMLHVSDAPLPATNFHWPLGQGSVDLAANCAALARAGFQGPAILEIGGTPWSGGYGQDTDEALRESRRRLQAAADACA